MLEVQTITVFIDKDWRQVYETIWRPQAFPRWASGLSQAGLKQEGQVWTAQGPEGPITIRFTPHNDLGVMDHYVDVGTGQDVYIPLRVIQNGAGAQVMLTLFRQPGMTDEKFAADADWVRRDMRALQELFA